MIWNLLTWCVFGLIAGAVARALHPGPDRMGMLGTILLGMTGSLLGGFIGFLLWPMGRNGFQGAGFIMSVLMAVVVLYFLRRMESPKRV